MDAVVFDPSTVSFGTPTKLGSSQQTVIPMTTEAGRFDFSSRITLQFGRDQEDMLVSKWGLSTPYQGSDPNRRNIEVEPSAEIERVLRAMDTAVVEYCTSNCETLFKTKTLLKQHTPLLIDKTDEGKGKSVRFKVVCGGNVTPTEIREFNAEKTKVARRDHTCLKGNCKVLIIADTPGIWVSPTAYGVSFTARSIIVQPTTAMQGLARFNLKPGVVETSDEIETPDDA